MNGKILEVSVPGKLFIAGEYAVLDGSPAIVIAVDRFMRGTIGPGEKNELSLPDLGLDLVDWSYDDGELRFSVPSKRLKFVKNALAMSIQYLIEKGVSVTPFSLRIVSELDDASGKKYGLGSSAATVVTTITAVLHYFLADEATKELIFKLAAIAHFKTQGSGSCADIAAATYGGWIQYSMFDRNWLLKEMKRKKPLADLLTQTWPGLGISPLSPPENFYLCVGWTGKKASTPSMVGKIQHLKRYYLADYEQFIRASREAVNKITTGFRERDRMEIFQGLKQNRMALKRLGELTGVEIETEDLAQLIALADRYGVGKTSGAGGGDCGIAFVPDREAKVKLIDDWRRQGIQPLELSVSYGGITVKRVESI